MGRGQQRAKERAAKARRDAKAAQTSDAAADKDEAKTEKYSFKGNRWQTN